MSRISIQPFSVHKCRGYSQRKKNVPDDPGKYMEEQPMSLHGFYIFADNQ